MRAAASVSNPPRTHSALIYLCTRSALNHVLLRVRRLKEPRYLIGALFALGYLYFIFMMPNQRRAAREASPVAQVLPEFVTTAGALVLLLLFAVMWLWRRGRTTLQLSEAEITWLFPAPVAHATIVHFSLLRMQAPLVLSAVLITLFTAMWDLPSPPWARAFGWWLVLAVTMLHTVASGFTCTRLLERGIAQWKRQFGVLALIGIGAWLLPVLDPHLRLPTPAESANPEALVPYLLEQTGSGALYWILAPLRALVGPFVAEDLPAFLRALGPALLVYVLHYYWAFRSERADVEATIENAAKRATMIAAMRRNAFRATLSPLKARPDPFRLSARSSPVVALFWKNLLSTRAYFNWRTFAAIASVIVAWNLWLGTPERIGPLARIPMILAFFIAVQTLFIGALLARQDLRNDLENADLMKTWPLPGWQIVLGEILAPVCILSAVVWLCLLQLTLGAQPPAESAIAPYFRWVVGGVLALLLPLWLATQVLVANAVAVLFPAWAKTSNQAVGWETIAPRLLFLFGALLASIVAALPATLGGALVYIPASWFTGNLALVPAALVAAVIMAAELAWGIDWLGRRFEAYDLAN